jgi:hypothetical protein
MFIYSNLKKGRNFNFLLNTQFKSFQNKIKITNENLKIVNSNAYRKVTLSGFSENTLKEKTFYFGIYKIILNLLIKLML